MSATAAEIEHAAEVLRRGGLVAFPTETVYGLGADATDDAALARLYAVKGRPVGHPVIVHLADGAALDDLADAVPQWARVLADACWPGPLTLVVHRRPGVVSDRAAGGLDTVGVRVPAHPVALAFLRAAARPVAAPSANRFGRVSPTTAAHVRDDLGPDVDVVLDGGSTTVGVESTIVDCTGGRPVVLRQGGITVERIAALTGREVVVGGSTKAPGTLPAHYAPRARVVVVDAPGLEDAVGAARAAAARVAVLVPAAVLAGVDRAGFDSDGGVVVLDAPSDGDEYARVLYARLREADDHGVDVVVAVPPPEVGIGAAVVDRLQRAARA